MKCTKEAMRGFLRMLMFRGWVSYVLIEEVYTI